MTLPVQVPQIEYAEDGVSTSFPIPFRYRDPAHIKAHRVATDGAITTLVNGNDFTVSVGDDASGGTLTVMFPASAGDLVIWRETPLKSDGDYETTGPFQARTHEDLLDEAAMRDQDLRLDLNRAIRVPRGETGYQMPARQQRSDAVLGFGAAGDLTILPVTELLQLPTTDDLDGGQFDDDESGIFLDGGIYG